MEPGAVFNPTYKSLHAKMVKQNAQCARTTLGIEDQTGTYATEIRRCSQMYERIIQAMEVDPA